MKKIHYLIFLSFLFSFTKVQSTCLNGTYTIGGASPDYATFSSAVSALITNGICGPVVFHVRDAVYTEQFSIPAITGASATNTITFDAENTVSPNVNVQYPASGSPAGNYVAELNNCHYVTFHNLRFYRTSANTYARVIALVNNCSYDQFLNNNLQTLSGNNTPDNFSVIWSDTTTNANLLFDGNTINGGSYGIDLIGHTLTLSQGNIIRNNIFYDQRSYNVFARNQDGITMTGNRSTQQFSYNNMVGLMLYHCLNGCLIDRNQLYTDGNSIYLFDCTTNSSAPNTITNNFGRTNGATAITIFNDNYVDLINNSCSMLSNSQGTGIYVEGGSNVRLLNNCLSSGLYTLDIYTSSSVTACDYNDLFLTHGLRWNSTFYSGISSWRTATGYDANSKTVDPGFVNGYTNLHITTNVDIESRGLYVPTVTHDVDNTTRNNPPDIGADEFVTPPDNSQLLSTQLSFPVCPGSNPVNARFRNIGMLPISTLMLGWKVNNVIQPPVQFNGTILSGDTSAYITLGNYVFTQNQSYNVKIWCYSPNGNPDPTPQNDTITFTGGQTKMSGTYNIGGLSSNYPSFTAAVNALNARGVCSPVTFNVWDGIYIEKVYLTHVPGTSPTNRITFQSTNDDSTLVHLQYAASSSSFQNYIIMFDGADYFTFRKMTITRMDYPFSDYGMVVDFNNSAIGNVLENNVIQGETYTSPSYPNGSESIIHSSNITTLKNDSNTIQNNLILYGTSGIAITRGTGVLPESGWIVRNNQLIGQSEMGIGATNQNNILIQGNTINTIRDTVSNSVFYGILLSKVYNNARTCYNIINHKSGYGILVSGCPATLANPGLVYNNMISDKEIGLYISGTTYYRFIHNSINVRGPVSTSYDFFQTGSSGITMWNNIFVNSNGGKIFTTTPATNLISNHNDFYTSGAFSTSYATLAAWRTTLHDTNSVFIQPGFLSVTDLHIPFNDTLNNRGDSTLSFIDDHDRVHRYHAHPDLGADEFDSAGVYDVGVTHFISPDGTNCHGMPYVIVTVKNFDTVAADTVKSLTLYLRINSVMVDTTYWTGILVPGDSLQLVATPLYYFQYGQNYIIRSWTGLPNNSIDANPVNDTLTLNTGLISMGGTYEIGGIDPDFHTFNAAKNALASLGVCDSVIFNIHTGLYQEQVDFPAIPGAAYNRSITFRSQTLDSSDAVLSFITATTVNDWILYLDGSDYFRFCNMSIGEYTPAGITLSPVVVLHNGASYNQFHNDVLMGRNAYSGPQFATVALAGNGNDHNRIERNRFIRGSYNVLVDSVSAGNYDHDIVIRDNQIYNANVCLFNVSRVDTLLIENNSIKSVAAGVTWIAVGNCRGHINVSRNQLYMGKTGISMVACNGTAADPILVSNNFYGSRNNNIDHFYGILIDTCNYLNIIHNSIGIEPPQPDYGNGQLYSGIMLYSGSNINVFNNNIALYNSWLAIFSARANIMNACDYNNYYTAYGRVANFPTNTIYPAAGDTLHLNAWQALTGFDLHTTTVDPRFYYRDPNFTGTLMDLHLDPYNIVPLTSVLYFPSVAKDIDNDIRSTTQPTVGADEFIPSSNDATLVSMFPGTSICSGNNTVSVRIRNIGTQPLTSLTIAWSVNAIAQPSYNWTGALNFGDSTLVTIGNYNFPLGSSSVTIISQSPNGNVDPTPLGDTLYRIYSASAIPLPNLGPDLQICPSTTTSLNPGAFNNYLWSEGSSTTTITVGPGTYSVIVSNVAGCSNADTIVVGLAAAPTVTVSGNLSTCSGSGTTLTASGASTYVWMPGNLTGATVTLNPVTSTNYTVTGTSSSGCTGTHTFSITVTSLPAIGISGSASICAGSSTTLTVSGAISYLWMPGNLSGSTVTLSPATTTTYTITGTAASGCSNTITITVTVHPLPTITTNGSTTICDGGSAVLNASGGGNFVWMPGNLSGSAVVVTPTITTTYTVTGTGSFGCTNSATATVTVNQLPSLTYVQNPSTVCVNWNPITLSAASPAGGIYSGPGVTGNTFDPAAVGAGTWTIVYSYTDINNCSNSISQQIIVDLCLGITSSDPQNISIDPNPFHDKLKVEVNAVSDMIIYNSLGQVVGSWKLATGENEIEVGFLSSGIYLVRIASGNSVLEKKMIREN